MIFRGVITHGSHVVITLDLAPPTFAMNMEKHSRNSTKTINIFSLLMAIAEKHPNKLWCSECCVYIWPQNKSIHSKTMKHKYNTYANHDENKCILIDTKMSPSRPTHQMSQNTYTTNTCTKHHVLLVCVLLFPMRSIMRPYHESLQRLSTWRLHLFGIQIVVV